MQASPEMGTSFSEALAPRDIATMGALCALLAPSASLQCTCQSQPEKLPIPVQASPEMGTSFSEALAPGDIATMGALCALASLSRPELKRQVVDNLGFREYLEAVPEVGMLLIPLLPFPTCPCLNVSMLEATYQYLKAVLCCAGGGHAFLGDSSLYILP